MTTRTSRITAHGVWHDRQLDRKVPVKVLPHGDVLGTGSPQLRVLMPPNDIERIVDASDVEVLDNGDIALTDKAREFLNGRGE